ncbi:MAG: c-type cytochrome [Dongiaceae bacterium]
MRAMALLMLAVMLTALPERLSRADSDVQLGARAFEACAACHSLIPGRHLTGPSLADIWDKQAGTVAGFPRYSPALKAADIIWGLESLDAWLANPRAFIPKTRMTFPGIDDAKTRADLIAFLQAVSSGQMKAEGGDKMGGGMMGGMMHGTEQSLKALAPRQQVVAISYCGDTYDVGTADGETLQFWEPNLRFKTDSSADGPAAGKPAILPSGMLGDRASIIFAAPAEISPLIKSECR